MEQSELIPQVQVEEVTKNAPVKKRRGFPTRNELETLVKSHKIPNTEIAPKRNGNPSKLEKQTTDWQMEQMRLINADILMSIRKRIKNKELDIKDEIQLFKSIAPFLGYSSSSQKSCEDIGMDAFAEKFVEIEAKVKSTSRIAVSKV